MRSLSLAVLITLTLLSSSLCSFVNAQVKDSELDEARKAFSKVYKEVSEEKEEAKKYEKAKAFFARFPNADDEVVCCDWVRNMRRFVERYELRQIYNKCAEADKSYFATPNADNLNNLTTACDEYLVKLPTPEIAVSNRLALATGFGVLAGFYKDTDRSFSYAEKALKLLAPIAPPKDWPPDMWTKFRTENIGRLLQYQGLFKLRQEPPDAEAANVYLTKAAEAKDGPAFKDPNTYLLRAEANANLYTKLNTELNALPNEEKIGQKGKSLLASILATKNKIAEDYARIVVLTKYTDDSAIYKDARTMLKEVYRHKDMAALIKKCQQEFGIK